MVFNRIGDLTMSTPLFRALAGRGELSLLTRPFGVPLLAGQSFVNKVYSLPYPNRGRPGLGNLLLGGHRRALAKNLRKDGFSDVWIYDTERPVIKRWLAGAFPGKVKEIPRREAPGKHASTFYREAAAYTGCDMDRYDPHPTLEIPPDRRAEAQRLLGELGQRVVGVQMGSQRTAAWRLRRRPDLKALTSHQWAALVTRLIAEDHTDAVAIHGAPSEKRMVRRFIRGLPASVRPRCHDLSTRASLDLLPALLAGHQALISVDTGPAHIAAAVSCPLLVFFGPTDPAVFAPRVKGPVEVLVGRAPCQFCHATPLYRECRDNRCLNRVPDSQLWESWSRLRDKL